MELEAMREIPWSMYDDGNNTVSTVQCIDCPVTLPISVDPEKQLNVILVPHITTRHSSPVVAEFVSQTIMPFGSPTPSDVEGQEGSRPPPVAGGEAETTDRPSSTRSVSTPSITTTPELGIDMTRPDQDTSDSVEPKESESPPYTITIPELPCCCASGTGQ